MISVSGGVLSNIGVTGNSQYHSCKTCDLKIAPFEIYFHCFLYKYFGKIWFKSKTSFTLIEQNEY
jgi:hypothetical protein